jgi:GT2 family glycosyltransferase/glycosyltransferase involved in cell wall biosynthesis
MSMSKQRQKARRNRFLPRDRDPVADGSLASWLADRVLGASNGRRQPIPSSDKPIPSSDIGEPRLKGCIDRIEAGRSYIAIEGWLLLEDGEPNDRAIFANDAEVEGRWFALWREDLQAQGLGDGQAGFRVLAPIESFLDPGTGALIAPQLGLRMCGERICFAQSDFAPVEPRGYLDTIENGVLSGWVDVANVGSDAQPALTVNGAPVWPLEPDLPRPDVVAAGMAFDENVGFAVPVAAILGAAKHLPFLANAAPATSVSIGLVAAGRDLGAIEVDLPDELNVRLERFKEGRLSGWAVRPSGIGRTVDVDILIDGLKFATVCADQARSDVRKVFPWHDGGEFRLDIPFSPTGNPTFEIAIARCGQTTPLAGAARLSVTNAAVHRRYAEGAPLQPSAGDSNSDVAIIIPIYNAADDVEACLESLIRHTTGRVKAIIIDDKSPDERIQQIFWRYRDVRGFEFYTNETNLGMTRTNNKGIGLAGRADIVFLNSDTIVTPRWLEGLRTAAYSARDVGTVTAISDNAGAFSVPEMGLANPLPPWMSREQYARALRQAMPGLPPRVPTGSGFCFYIRRDCLDDIGLPDEAAFPRGYGEENDFCMRAWRKGWVHVIDDKTLIYHRRSASFGDEKTELNRNGRAIVDDRYPEYRKAITVFRTSPEILTMRYTARAVASGLDARATGRMRILYVVSTQTGGTPQTNGDLMQGLADEFDTWLLRCDSRVMELTRSGDNAIVERHILETPIDIISHRAKEYDNVVAGWLHRHAFELVHIRHISWHSLGLVDRCTALSIPVVFSFHDFYTICPTIKLLDDMLRFCGGTCTPGNGTCTVELWPADRVPPLKHRWINQWRVMMDAVLRQCAAFVTTSQSAHDTLVSQFPFLQERLFDLIPHGRSLAMHRASARAPRPFGQIRILVPGNINDAKGARQILALRDADKLGRFEFHILGNAVKELAGPRIIRHGPYQRNEFAARALDIKAQFGAIFSIWPETYCHTLTELWSVGLPVLAFDFGAVAERIRSSGGGWLLPHEAPEAMIGALLRIVQDPDDYQRKSNAIWAWQESEVTRNTIPIMAERYVGLYRKVLAARAAFHSGTGDRSAVALVGTLAPGNHRRNAAPGSTFVRLWEWTRNADTRPVRYMRLENADLCDDERVAGLSAVIVQRNALDPLIVDDVIARCHRQGTALLVEIDDDLLDVPHGKDPDGRYAAIAPSLERLLQASDSIIVSTEPLRVRLAPLNPDIKIFENRLSSRLWFAPLSSEPSPDIPARTTADEIRILYMGSETHEADLDLMREPMERLKRNMPNVRFWVIGGARNPQPWFEVIERPKDNYDYPNFVPWFRKLAQSMDFAVAPLVEDRFNETKSALKCLEYAGAGLFGLYSDMPCYRPIVERHGFGRLIPAGPDKWLDALMSTIADLDTIRRGREERIARVRTNYSLDDRIGEYDAHVMSVIGKVSSRVSPLEPAG